MSPNGLLNALDDELLAYLVEVDDWLPELVLHLVEVSHTDLSEVTRVVLVHVGTVVVLTTGKTTSTGMLSVLSDTTVSGTDVTSQLASLGGVSWHFGDVCCRKIRVRWKVKWKSASQIFVRQPEPRVPSR